MTADTAATSAGGLWAASKVRVVQVPTRSDAAPAGAARIVWDALVALLPAATGEVRVLDCGGGTGTLAVPLARIGAHVTVVDISVDALSILERRAGEAAVAERIRAVQGDVERLDDVVAGERFALVLAHGILEAVDDPAAAFAGISAAVEPGGRLSVLIRNPVARVLGRALAGDVGAALAEMRGLDTELGHPGPSGVRALCADAGLQVEAVQGIGVFSELIPGAALDLPGALDELAALETEAATRPPFSEIAARVHVIARRPAS